MEKHILLSQSEHTAASMLMTASEMNIAARTFAEEVGIQFVGSEDFSLIQGQTCLCIRIKGQDEAIAKYLKRCEEQSLQVVDADARIHELEKDDVSKGEHQNDE